MISGLCSTRSRPRSASSRRRSSWSMPIGPTGPSIAAQAPWAALSRSDSDCCFCSEVSGTNSASCASESELSSRYCTNAFDLGLLDRRALHVHEERPCERLVGAVLGRFDARRDAAVAGVDLERLQLVLVLVVVGEAEVAECALLARDAVDDHVVVLARAVVRAARALLAVDRVGEVVEGARVGARPEELQLFVRQTRVDVLPTLDLRRRAPRSSSAGRGQTGRPSRSPGSRPP